MVERAEMWWKHFLRKTFWKKGASRTTAVRSPRVRCAVRPVLGCLHTATESAESSGTYTSYIRTATNNCVQTAAAAAAGSWWGIVWSHTYIHHVLQTETKTLRTNVDYDVRACLCSVFEAVCVFHQLVGVLCLALSSCQVCLSNQYSLEGIPVQYDLPRIKIHTLGYNLFLL